jgi:hypothetical protein
MHARTRIVTLAALSVTLLVAVAAQAATGQSTRTVTLIELEKGSTFTHIRNTKATSPRANSTGDQIVMTYPLADRARRVVGKLHVDCVTTAGAKLFPQSTVSCGGVLDLRDGTLTVQTVFKLDGSPVRGAVTGGTGAYAGARGTFVSKQAKGGSVDTFTLES